MKQWEALAPWVIVQLISVAAAVLIGRDVFLAASVAAWIGAAISILWINHRFTGHPLKF